MRARSRRRLTTLALGLLCVGLAAVVYGEVRGERGAAVRVPAPAVGAGATVTDVAAAPGDETPADATRPPPPLQAFAEVVERPLFNQSRRPPEAPAAAPAPVVRASLDHLALVGVLISPEERVALFEQPRMPPILEVREGEQLEGWTVESISSGAVVLRWGEERVTMTFAEQDAPRAAPERGPIRRGGRPPNRPGRGATPNTEEAPPLPAPPATPPLPAGREAALETTPRTQ